MPNKNKKIKNTKAKRCTRPAGSDYSSALLAALLRSCRYLSENLDGCPPEKKCEGKDYDACVICWRDWLLSATRCDDCLKEQKGRVIVCENTETGEKRRVCLKCFEKYVAEVKKSIS